MRSHPSALYSLAIIQFNGSGGSKSDKNLPAGVTLCARAAHLGHLDALRELGYCLQDGYGVRRDAERGRRFLCQATALELSAFASHCYNVSVSGLKAGLANGSVKMDWSSIAQALDPHPASRFLVEWWSSREEGEAREEGIRACSHVLCGRVETRRHEFRRCSVCGNANYCSRACQAMDWKRVHRDDCKPQDPFIADMVVYAGEIQAALID
jgi:MYND finger/Sel1 repeat